MRHYSFGYIGNFSGAPFTTENDIRETLESMGHGVIKIQENQWSGDLPPLEQIDALIYTHTHGWGPPDPVVRAALTRCASAGVPTIGFHLDLWRGLKSREAQVGTSAFFTCDYVFSPDGDDPSFWEAHGVNHIYSPPGVLEASCYLAEPDPVQHKWPIVFVGARMRANGIGYHVEHKWRAVMQDWLEAHYRDRFRCYEHSSAMRQHKLNVLYATARCVVGDSCFAGEVAGYTSDRFPETLGRGGLLAYPRIDGVTDDAPVETFKPGDLESVREAVERVLALSPEEAHARRLDAIRFVKAGWTYRHRWEAIIDRLEADGALSGEA